MVGAAEAGGRRDAEIAQRTDAAGGDEKTNTGSAFIVMGVANRRSLPALTLQMFEVEQLATEKDTSEPRKDGSEIRGGIESDAYGAPLAYWVHLKQHPLERGAFERMRGGGGAVRIDASRVLHYTRQGRVRETLATSPLSPVLRQMFDRRGYDANELFAKKIESFLAFAIKKNPKWGDLANLGFAPPTGATASDGGGDSQDAGGNRQLDFEQGMVPVLYPGEEIQDFHFNRPAANYGQYMSHQVDMIAAGAELSGSVVRRKVTGSYSRRGRKYSKTGRCTTSSSRI